MSRAPWPAGSSPTSPPGCGLGGSTMKLYGRLVWPPAVTVTGPLVATTGTASESVMADAVAGVLSVPLKVTTLFGGAGLNPVPLITTDAPEGPAGGVINVIATDGGAWMVKRPVAPVSSGWPSVSTAPGATTSEQR